MFSNTLSFLSSRNVTDQVSHPYKTTGKIIFLYIQPDFFWSGNMEDVCPIIQQPEHKPDDSDLNAESKNV